MGRDTPLQLGSQLISALFLEVFASLGMLPPLNSHSLISQASKDLTTKIMLFEFGPQQQDGESIMEKISWWV